MKNLTEAEEKYLLRKRKWHGDKSRIFFGGVAFGGFVLLFLCLFSFFSKFSFFDLKTALLLQAVFLIALVLVGIREILNEKKFLLIIEKLEKSLDE